MDAANDLGALPRQYASSPQDDLLHTIFLANPGGLAILTYPDLVYRQVNQAFRAMTPDPAVDPLGRTLPEIWPETTVEQATEYFGQLIASGQSKSDAFFRAYPDGSTRYFSVHTHPFTWRDRPALLVALWETTQLEQTLQQVRRREAELQESEARFRALADNIPQLAWMADPTGWIFWYNQRWFDFTGATLAEMEGWGWQQVHHPAHVNRVIEKFRRCILAGEVWEDTFPLRGKNGRYRWFLSRAVPIRDSAGRVIRWFGTNTDVTEQREAEQALRESQERMRVALDGKPIIVFSMDSDLRYTWIYAPSSVMTPEQIVGRRDDELMGISEANELMALKRTVLRTGQPMQAENRLQVNGEWTYYLINLDPMLDENGEVSGLTGAAINVTGQRQAEQQRQEFLAEVTVQRSLLEHREQERKEIARDIHDGPIQSLVSILFNLKTAREAVQDPQVSAILDEVTRGLKSTVQELREVVNDLRPPALLAFGLSRVIRIHMEDVRDKHPEARLELELFEGPDGLSEDACLTLYRIYQESLTNIFRHAGADRVWVRYYPNSHGMILEIQDNGKGFNDPADVVSLTQGNHFGIAGMIERVEAIGGWLKVSSHPGLGTTIRVGVPVAKKS